MSIPALRRILYVEDEADIQDLVRMSLEDIGGFELEISSTSEEALSIAGQFNPDLFLLDVMMPGMDGPTLFKKLRSIPGLESKPAVFITAKVQMQELAEFSDLGVLGIIRKPFDPLGISTTIVDLWNDYYKKDCNQTQLS